MQAEFDENTGVVKKSRVTRKHVIIAVTCAVVAAMVITGILVGVKFFLDSTNDIVKVAVTDIDIVSTTIYTSSHITIVRQIVTFNTSDAANVVGESLQRQRFFSLELTVI